MLEGCDIPAVLTERTDEFVGNGGPDVRLREPPPIAANRFDKSRQGALRMAAMNSRLPRTDVLASAPELRSSILLGVVGLLPLISSGCGPPS